MEILPRQQPIRRRLKGGLAKFAWPSMLGPGSSRGLALQGSACRGDCCSRPWWPRGSSLSLKRGLCVPVSGDKAPVQWGQGGWPSTHTPWWGSRLCQQGGGGLWAPHPHPSPGYESVLYHCIVSPWTKKRAWSISTIIGVPSWVLAWPVEWQAMPKGLATEICTYDNARIAIFSTCLSDIIFLII